MKKLIMLAVVALAVVCEAAPRRSKMPVDENGWRCEGDCDPSTPCAFCNPPPKAKRSAAKKAAKKPRKSSDKAKKSGARKRSRKAVKTPVNEG